MMKQHSRIDSPHWRFLKLESSTDPRDIIWAQIGSYIDTVYANGVLGLLGLVFLKG